MSVAITAPTVPFRRRFNPKKANWEQYAYQLDAAVENIPTTAECYDQFVNALRKFARKNISRGCRRNYVPGLTPESIELIEEYREKYEDDQFADSICHHTRGKSTEQTTESSPRSTAIPGRPGIHETIYCSGTRHRYESTDERQAPGLDDIQTELIKQFGPNARNWLLRLFNNCTATKIIPMIWRQARVVALLTPRKDPSVAKSF